MLLLSGCFRSGSSIYYYSLEGARCEHPLQTSIRVYEFEASPLIQSRLLFGNTPYEFGEFQTVRWKDSPGSAIAQSLQEALLCKGGDMTLKNPVLRIYGKIIRMELSSSYEPIIEVELRLLTTSGLQSKVFMYKDSPLSDPTPQLVISSLNEQIKRFQVDALTYIQQ